MKRLLWALRDFCMMDNHLHETRFVEKTHNALATDEAGTFLAKLLQDGTADGLYDIGMQPGGLRTA